MPAGRRRHHGGAPARAGVRRAPAGEPVAPVVTGELREGLGFDGLIVTDDLFMKGCTARLPLSRRRRSTPSPPATTWCCCASPTSTSRRRHSRRSCTPLEDGTSARRAGGTVRSRRQLAAKARFVTDPDDARTPVDALARPDRLRCPSADCRGVAAACVSPARSAPAIAVAVVAPASPFPREEFDRGLAELSASRVRAGLRRACVRRATSTSPGTRACAPRRRSSTPGVTPAIGGRHGRARRVRQHADPPARRAGAARAAAEGLRRVAAI